MDTVAGMTLTGVGMVRVLGPCSVELTADGRAVVETVELSLVQRTILVRPARPLGLGRLDDLIDSVWGDEPPATARTSIHNQISRIRTRLGLDIVVTHGGRYSWRSPPTSRWSLRH